MMHALLHSRFWYFPLLGITVLAIVVGWLVKDGVYAQHPHSWQWTKTEFTSPSSLCLTRPYLLR